MPREDREMLSPDQFSTLVSKMSERISMVVLDAIRHAVPRASFTVSEIARRNSFSTDYVYRSIRGGKLAAVRPGGGSQMRVTVDAERMWLWGQCDYADEPAMGVDPKVAARAARRRFAK